MRRTQFTRYLDHPLSVDILPTQIDELEFFILLVVGINTTSELSQTYLNIMKIPGHKKTPPEQMQKAINRMRAQNLLEFTDDKKERLTPDGMLYLFIHAHINEFYGGKVDSILKTIKDKGGEAYFILKMLSAYNYMNFEVEKNLDGLLKMFGSIYFWKLSLNKYGVEYYSQIVPLLIFMQAGDNNFTILKILNMPENKGKYSDTKIKYNNESDSWMYDENSVIAKVFENPLGIDYLNHRKEFKLKNNTFGMIDIIDFILMRIFSPENIDDHQESLVKKFNKIDFFMQTYFRTKCLLAFHNDSDLANFLMNPKLIEILMEHDSKIQRYGLILIFLYALLLRENNGYKKIQESFKENVKLKELLQQKMDTPFMKMLQRLAYEILEIKSDVPPFFKIIPTSDRLITNLKRLSSLQIKNLKQERLSWTISSDYNLNAKVQKMGKSGWSAGRQVNIMTVNGLIKENKIEYEDIDAGITSYVIREMLSLKDLPLNMNLVRFLSKSNNVYDEQGLKVNFIAQRKLVIFEQNNKDIKVSIHPEKINKKIQLMDTEIEQVFEGVYKFDPSDIITSSMVNELAKASAISVELKDQVLELIKPHVDYYDELTNQGSIQIVEWGTTPQLWLSLEKMHISINIEHQSKNGEVSHLSAEGDTWIEVSKLKWAKRDLKVERAQLKYINELLEIEVEEDKYQNQLVIPLSQASTVIEKLSELDDVKLHWRKNSKRLQVVKASDFSLSINQKGSWFNVKGGVQIDGVEFIQLKRLLNAKRTGFIELEKDNIQLILSQALQDKINLLDSVLNDELSVESTLAYPLQKLIESMHVESDKGWQKLAKEWSKPVKIDSKLLAPLRDYQRTSVNWAIHLLTNGFGACLADDMGLGKTIQALKVMEHFGHGGASLVIAPKSVLHNWASETRKFAKKMNAIILDEQEDKAKVIHSAKEHDILIIGYSQAPLFETELNDKQWQTVVLDEAQNIKNPTAKRTQALVSLKAKGKMTLSGTPIENHLMELWSQFSFLNPGLLGTLTQFKAKYGQAAKDEKDMARLRALVGPFIMRRLKKEVLKELPDKIEINHTITLNENELTAYEAVRQTALEQAKMNPIELLAALTRLRQICCDPYLVFNEKTQISSKLEEAINLIQEGVEGGHRILVFSQFVTLLERLGHFLGKESIVYSYLDGKTALKKRETEIDKFKKGKNSVFLISLKAGGTGLNLTEADMVIHLDPWWNPAVEDQASDRAHRMGQTQPVTIYRLITENTIEEKIIALHQEKRDLAEKVLSGQDGPQKLDPAVLLSLLSD